MVVDALFKMKSHFELNKKYINSFFCEKDQIDRICKIASEIYIEEAPVDPKIAPEENPATIYLPSGQTLQDVVERAQSIIYESLHHPQRFSTPIVRANQSPPSDALSALVSAIDSEQRPLLDFCLAAYEDSIFSDLAPVRTTCLVFGLLGLVGFDDLEPNKLSSIQSIIIVEHSYENIAAFFTIAKISSLLDFLKSYGIGFSFIFADSDKNLISELQSFIVMKEPTSVYSLTLCQPVVPSPVFAGVKGWIESPQGLCGTIDYLFGNETDEINQYAHARANLSGKFFSTKAAQISPLAEVDNSGKFIVLAASGPSLDDEIQFLRNISKHACIVASGSAIGALLRNGVAVTALVVLEMSSVVYWDLVNLADEGYDLKPIELIASNTVDPRIPDLFKRATFFARPSSSTSSLLESISTSSFLPSAGPQVANAALEALLLVGYRNIYLAGCDFAAVKPTHSRAQLALGSSIRVMDLPVQGRRGKTIYTNPDLLITAQCFSNVLIGFSATAITVGDGAKLGNTSIIDDREGYEFISASDLINRLDKCHDVSPLGLYASCSNMPVKQSAALFFEHNSIVAASTIIVKRIADDINKNVRWNRALQRNLNEYLVFGTSSQGPDPLSDIVRRIMRSLLFFIIRPLEAAPDQKYSQVAEQCSQSLVRAANVVTSLLVAVEKQCSIENSNRHWSPELLRRKVSECSP